MNSLIQWSVNGAFQHLAELENLAAQQQPFMICLQRCKLTPKEEFKLRNFVSYGIDNENESCPGDVLTLVHESAPVVRPIKIDSRIRTVAVTVALPGTHASTVTVCNMHVSSCDAEPTHRDIQNIIYQLPKPFILLGNFFDESTLETLMFANPELDVINEDDVFTHLDRATGHFFVEDVTIVTSDLTDKITWEAYGDLNDSDHFPIKLTFPLESIHYTHSRSKWLIDDANWALFEKQTEIKARNSSDDVAKDIEFLNKTLLEAGHLAIPKSSSEPIIKRRLPWWTDTIKAAVRKRKSALSQLKTRPSIAKLKKYIECCDSARSLITRAQQQHWDEFTASINENSPMPSNWRKIHYIHGKHQKNPPVRAIFRENELVTNPDEIVDVLASHYATVSSNASYSPEFLEKKTINEAIRADFSRSIDEYYNCPISMRELDYCLNNHNFHSSAGPDEIHPMMLKHFHVSAKEFLLLIYNEIWSSGEFPAKWKLAMIIPTLKKNKDKTLAASYRPVALTSALAKVFEKIIQKRLMWVLESKNYWSDHQYGFRKQRSTVQALTDLQLRVKKAFDEKSHLYAVFFDLQTASETVWKHQILMHLHAAGIRGRMGHLIENFLSRREIFVRIGKSVSRTYQMENGLPQGSILSETLLLVALNDIQNAIKPPVNFALFVDDLVITYESKSPKEAGPIVQKSINNITNWASDRGFKFSAAKTTVLDFYESGSCEEQPELTISGQELRFSETVSYLGLTIDSRLTWEQHINSLREISSDILALMNKINNNQRGGDQKMLLRVYTSLIKSRLDYGCLAFGSADPKLLNILESIQNIAIRIATGAYSTSPSSSLNSISGIFPLTVSRQLLSANFLASAFSVPNLPLNKMIFDSEGNLHDKSLSYLIYITKNFEAYLPNFSVFTLNPPLPQIFSDPPPWLLKKPIVDLSLTKYANIENPVDLPVAEIREKFASVMTKYADYTSCYTDGSKTDEWVGAAFSVSSFVKKFRLLKQSSSFTAELVAIFKCLEYLTSYQTLSHFLIISDSLNALEMLQDTYTFHPIVQRILLVHNTLIKSDKKVTFLWVPGHAGIAGNEIIDAAAREASRLPKVKCLIYSSHDVKSHLKSLIIDSWQKSWESQKCNELVFIKPNVLLPATSPFHSKKESDILTRLRISHTQLTHSYLLFKGRQQPSCPYCREAKLTVGHILISCSHLEKKRSEFNLQASSLHDLLKDESPHIGNLFSFLESLGVLNKI